MIRIEIEGENTKTFERDGKRFARFGFSESWKKATIAISANFRKTERQLFSSQGSSGGHGKWARLSPRYKKWKQKNYPGKPVMILTGALSDSLTRKTGDTINYTSRFGNTHQLVMGTDAKSGDGFDYPLHHQTKAKKRRRTIDITDQQAKKWVEILSSDVEKQARRSPFWDEVSPIGGGRFDRVQV